MFSMKLLSSISLVTLTLSGASASATPNSSPFTPGISASQESCVVLTPNSDPVCFIESVQNGRLVVHAPERFSNALMLEPTLTRNNIQPHTLADDDYLNLKTQLNANTVVYTRNVDGSSSAYIMNENCDQQGGSDRSSGGWWHDWGRCAAGTVGGALGGALGGAAAGSALPGVGTVAGGIVGGIAGGLGGAAGACGNSKDGEFEDARGC